MIADKDFDRCFRSSPIASNCRVSIVVPVRDEAATIRQSLEALANQILPPGIDQHSFEILLLANNCSDDSADIIRQFHHDMPMLAVRLDEIRLAPERANVGYVRRLLMNEAYARLRSTRSGSGVIMSTDGDTVVAPDWIAANLSEIERGADAVGGRILFSEPQLETMDAAARALHLVDERYRLLVAEIEALIDDLPFDGGPRHHQHFSASFAITTDAYEKSGGVPNVKFLEDCALYEALERADLRVRHSPDVIVFTSARSIGRSEVGLAFQINQWKKLGSEREAYLVENARSIVDRFTWKRELRKFWKAVREQGKTPSAEELNRLAEELRIPPHLLKEGLRRQKGFGECYIDLIREQARIGVRNERYSLQRVEDVVRDLIFVTEDLRAQAARSHTSSL